MVGNTLLLIIDVLSIVFVFISSYKPVAITTVFIFTEESPTSAPDPSQNSPPVPLAPNPI